MPIPFIRFRKLNPKALDKTINKEHSEKSILTTCPIFAVGDQLIRDCHSDS